MSSRKKSNLETALSWEKRSVSTYKKMEAEAKKKNALQVAKLFDSLGRDSEKRAEKIESLIKKMKREKRKIE